MNRARSRFRWLWLLAILLVVTPSSGDDGPSSVHVARYEIDVTPHGDDASFRVLIEYGDAATKADGFKFFGTSPVAKLHVTDEHGHALHFSTITQDHETKVSFDLAPGPSPRKTAILTFDQELDVEDAWFERSASVPWASKFRIPVHAMTVRLHGVSSASAPFGCRGSGATSVCVRSSRSPFLPSFSLGRTPAWVFVALAAALGLALVFVASVAARKRDTLIASRGVLPPVGEIAYVNPGDYRAAPVIPKGGAVEPVLGAGDLRAHRVRLIGAAISAGIPVVALVSASAASTAPHIVAAIALVVGCAIFGYLVIRQRPQVTVFLLPIATTVFGVFGGFISGTVGAILAALFGFGTFGFAHLMAVIGAALANSSTWRGSARGSSGSSGGGPSWSSWSSNSSSTSFSGGGGSSCGGGGGSSGGGGGCGG